MLGGLCIAGVALIIGMIVAHLMRDLPVVHRNPTANKYNIIMCGTVPVMIPNPYYKETDD